MDNNNNNNHHHHNHYHHHHNNNNNSSISISARGRTLRLTLVRSSLQFILHFPHVWYVT